MLTSWVAADILNPVTAGFFNASCDKAMFGWPCDARSRRCATSSPRRATRRSRSRSPCDLQKYWVDHPTHINLGQWYPPMALRNNVDGTLVAPAPVFWNVTKK